MAGTLSQARYGRCTGFLVASTKATIGILILKICSEIKEIG
jgi:hypothetical protein